MDTTSENELLQIIDYEPKYRQAFGDLNKEWITTYFWLEDSDHKVLNHPDEYIIDHGGHILVALFDGEPVGVCALVKMNDGMYDYEMSKMAVSPKMHGKRIGWALSKAVMEKARSLGAKKLYLESNTKLEPAIKMYYKMGFRKITKEGSAYERCNIQMELDL